MTAPLTISGVAVARALRVVNDVANTAGDEPVSAATMRLALETVAPMIVGAAFRNVAREWEQSASKATAKADDMTDPTDPSADQQMCALYRHANCLTTRANDLHRRAAELTGGTGAGT